MKVNEITEQIIGAAIEVHRALGPGLLESAYEACLSHELAERKLHAECQKALPVTYKDVLSSVVMPLHKLDYYDERDVAAVEEGNP